MAGMRLYRALCRVFPRSFRAKLMTVVLGGTLLPIVGFSLWLMANNGARPDHLLSGVLLALSLTLIGGVLSLLLVFRLLAPLRDVAEAIDRYEREQVLPRLGRLFAHDGGSYQYLAESIRQHPPQAELKAMMEAAGFARCDVHNLNAGIVAIHSGYRV